ncbi:MAG: hypothetical protein AYL28_006850 [Candidatus Bathyarchaeota archaeon B23]|nr:MAG: hypothetical protein AYL28_006850 [Candidatus Bathyarchaeota archaeon B23]
MLYHLGLGGGMMRGTRIFQEAASIGVSDLMEKCEIASGVFMSLGYGMLELLELREEPPYIHLRIHRSIECELGRSAGRPFSQFIRGIIAGFATICFKREMIAEESRCIAMGDPCCEFKIKPREA